MQANSKSVIETLRAIDAERIPDRRLRGLKPSVVRFAFAQKLIGDFRGHGVILTALGRSVLNASPIAHLRCHA